MKTNFEINFRLNSSNQIDEFKVRYETQADNLLATQEKVIRKYILGKRLEDALDSPSFASEVLTELEDVYGDKSPAFFLLWEKVMAELKQVRGQLPYIQNKSSDLKLDPDDLVCRCFGVYGEEIANLVRTEQARTLREVSRQLKVTLGCASCRDDVLEVLRSERKELSMRVAKKMSAIDRANTVDALADEVIGRWDSQGRSNRIGNLTPAQWMIRLDRGLQDFWPDFSQRYSEASKPFLGALEGNQALWFYTSDQNTGEWVEVFEGEFKEYFEKQYSQFFTHSLQRLRH